MPDNVLKAATDAIAESDNEIGGQLQTRLVQKAKWGRNDAFLATANPARIELPAGTGWFESWMVGLEIDVLAKSTPTGQEGRYACLTVDSSGDFATFEILGGGAPAWTDEDPVQIRLATLLVETTFEFLDPATHVTDTEGSLWVGLEPDRVVYGARQLAVGNMQFQQLGDPDTGEGYLTRDHKPLTEITEASQSYSALDHLRRALLVDYATEEELDRMARNLAVIRPAGTSDAIFREVIKVLAYLPKGTGFGLELLLAALFPAGGWTIYEDLINEPNTVFILLPTMDPGQAFEGRTFIDSEEPQAATSVTTVDVDHTPISVISVILADITLTLDMTVLPSADAVPWAYVNEGDVEGATFSIVTSTYLQHVQGPGDALGGRYQRTEAELGTAFPPGSYGVNEILWSFSINWIADVITTVGGNPWMLTVRDGVREYTMLWNTTGTNLGQSDGTLHAGSGPAPGTGTWRTMTIRRRGDVIEALMDGVVVLAESVGTFSVDVNTDFSFGYWNNSANQDWTVRWDTAGVRATTKWRNFWNLFRQTGALSVADADLDDGGNPFVAGDDGKHVRVYAPNNPENDGLWQASYVGAGTLTLDGVPLGRARVVAASAVEGFVILEEPWFRDVDVAKSVVISGSALGNDGTYPVLAWGSPLFLIVDTTALSGGFTAESLLTWKFDPSFVNQASVNYEVIDAGTVAAKTLTVHASEPGWPNAAQDVIVNYTSVLSAQLMRDETVENEGSGGAEPNIFYPFYLWDVEQGIRDLMDEVTAAGVIPEFERSF